MVIKHMLMLIKKSPGTDVFLDLYKALDILGITSLSVRT